VEALPARAAERLDKALALSEPMTALTRQLLTFSKGGAPEKARLELGPVLREGPAFALAGTGIEPVLEIDGGLWPIEGDRAQLAQVIDGLLLNARDAMPERGEIRIRAGNLIAREGELTGLPAGKYVLLSVYDTGHGMPPEVLRKAFDPFYSTKPGVAGLGLPICQSIIERHGGRIELESEPGQGTEARVYLPAAPLKADARGESPPAPAASWGGQVLVMDDEDFIREILGEHLTQAGYAVITASSGREALALCLPEGRPPLDIQAAFLDLTVPSGEGGLQIIGILRQAYPRIPIFAISGYADDPAIARPADFGFSASLRKPFERRSVLEALSRFAAREEAGHGR
jgi:CheY-like chemotaxis protein